MDGLTAPWYKIRTSDGLEGWVFGGVFRLGVGEKADGRMRKTELYWLKPVLLKR